MAGTPAIIELSGKDLVTTELLPTTQPLPRETLGIITEPLPIRHPLPIDTVAGIRVSVESNDLLRSYPWQITVTFRATRVLVPIEHDPDLHLRLKRLLMRTPEPKKENYCVG